MLFVCQSNSKNVLSIFGPVTMCLNLRRKTMWVGNYELLLKEALEEKGRISIDINKTIKLIDDVL